jgi:hypothetical protein
MTRLQADVDKQRAPETAIPLRRALAADTQPSPAPQPALWTNRTIAPSRSPPGVNRTNIVGRRCQT